MWLVDLKTRQQLERAEKEGFQPTAEQQAAFEARTPDRLSNINGDVAEIHINGILTDRPSYMASIFGGGNTTYPDIRGAIAEAEGNPAVKETKLIVGSSPGGNVAGLFDTIAALQAAKKPITAEVKDLAASATYALISQADEVKAKNRAARFGSIGVAVSYSVWPEDVDIASTLAPKKRPDVTTEEGKAIVREELDAIHELFADAVATGRSTTVENVNANFGQGATLLADEALSKGMVDAIDGPGLSIVRPPSSKTATNGGKHLEAKQMDLQTLKAQHPELFNEAVEIGARQERDRVTAHLVMGEQSGDMATAITAIKDGSEMTQTLTAQYMMAATNRRDLDNRDSDDASASGADSQDDSSQDDGEGVISSIERRCGVKGA